MPEVFVALAVLVFACGALVFLVMRWIVRPESNQALVIMTTKDVEVSFTNRLVMPGLHKVNVMDLSLKTIEIERRGRDGLICADNIRADITVTFFIRVNAHEHDILRVAKNVGCDRASSQDTIEELFNAKFSEALKTAGKQMEFKALFADRFRFRDTILLEIGKDLNGYVLEDVAIDYLEQTPLEHLDPNNVLDAQGRRKIVEETSKQIEAENQRKNEHDMIIGRQDLERQEAISNMERQEAEAIAQQATELLKIQTEQETRAELIRIEAERELAIARAQTERDVALARGEVLTKLDALAKRIDVLEALLAAQPGRAAPAQDGATPPAARDKHAPAPAAAHHDDGDDDIESARQEALRALGITDLD